ncbi:hypothetical protein CPB84DRAFT_325913 [Gymnopilus junonius]|uniref:Uncharacterized protein n=1 Tax=Gymnopilus junonius TaxID=109634 RepID=A0A9P5NCS8_GYMJU|nr:hypothetical protein CPB84DRAFT_325913 [Gymnopilus junonius]
MLLTRALKLFTNSCLGGPCSPPLCSWYYPIPPFAPILKLFDMILIQAIVLSKKSLHKCTTSSRCRCIWAFCPSRNTGIRCFRKVNRMWRRGTSWRVCFQIVLLAGGSVEVDGFCSLFCLFRLYHYRILKECLKSRARSSRPCVYLDMGTGRRVNALNTNKEEDDGNIG